MARVEADIENRMKIVLHDWAPYTAAQTHEKERFLNGSTDRCRTACELEHRNTGR